MPYIVKPREYADLLIVCEAAKQPLFVRGGPGIGKSAIPRQVFTKLAKSRDQIFIEWSDATLDQKKKCIEIPEKYYAFMDARTSQMDTTSLQGIPNMTKTDLLENIPYSWVVYFTQPKANGSIFFDEINLAAPIVQSITYSAIHDRVISDRRLSSNIFVFAAGNRQKDTTNVFDMPLPLRDRFAEVDIECDSEDWVNWAMTAKVNPHLISFINWKPSWLYKINENRNLKPSTPRGVCRASSLMRNINIEFAEWSEINMLISISCGEAFAAEFEAYVKCYKQLNWNQILKHPESIKKLELNQMFAISGGLVERFQRDPDDIPLIDKLFSVAECMNVDFTINTLRMMKDSNIKAFAVATGKLKKGGVFAEKYGKFMIEISNDN